MLHFFKLLFQLVLAPTQGWDDIAAAKLDPRKAVMHGLLPLVCLTALSVVVAAVWEIHLDPLNLAIRAVTTFATYMLSYFVCIWVSAAVLPHLSSDGLISRERIQLYSAFVVSQMALIGLLENLVPARLVLLQFLPLFLVVEIAKARDFLGADADRTGLVTTMGVCGAILPIYLFSYIFPS